jgi:hypothetical protein
MPSPQNNGDDGAVITPPQLPTAEQLFDALMGDIDPRFTMSGQKTLAQTLKGATEEEKIAILDAFNKAIAACETKAKEYFALLGDEVNAYRKCMEELGQVSEQSAAEGLLDAAS